jgi:putative redox protein
LENHLKTLQRALLIFHSPIDETVDIENANHIFAAANHPKSLISLAGADHLMSETGDAAYVAHLIASWADRYLD